jgi:class 3 adenylate cyclase/streptogramin lyase
VADSPPGDERERRAPGLRTFLIADVRGYTRFSQEHGDEAASRLANQFANIVREAVPSEAGELLELRGDEALCVFVSAREALRTAVELQRRFRERANGEPVLLLGVGIGLDAGEAVAIEGGYRGRALNVAARLCALARPGEILASETVANLAGHQDAASYARRRAARLKGLEEPVRYVEVVPDIELPPLPPPRPPKPRPRVRARRLRQRWVVALLGGALALAGLVALVALVRTGDEKGAVTRTPIVANSLAVIDARTNTVRADVPVGEDPGPIVEGTGAIWVGNESDETISRIDPASRRVVKTFGVGPIDGLASGQGSIWIASAGEGIVRRVDPSTNSIVESLRFRPQQEASEGIPVAMAFGEGGLWIGDRNSFSLLRIDPATGRTRRTPDVDAKALALGRGSVWVVSYANQEVVRIDSETGSIAAHIPVPADPSGIAVGDRAIWVAHDREGTVSEIDPYTALVERTFDRGAGGVERTVSGDITAMAASDGFVWIGNGFDHTISRVNEATRETDVISVGRRPAGLIANGGVIWATISRFRI